MAIDLMKKVTLVCQVAAVERLIRTLHKLGIVQLTDVMDEYEGASDHLHREEVSTEKCDDALHKVNLVLGLMDVFAPEKKGFIAGLSPVPLVIDPKELDDVLHHADAEKFYDIALELDTAYRHADRAISEIDNQLKELVPLEDVPIRVADMAKPKHVTLLFGVVPPSGLDAMASDAEAARMLAWEVVMPGKLLRKNGSGGEPTEYPATGKDPVRIVAAFMQQEEERARKLLAVHGFEEIPLPVLPGTVRDHIRELTGDRAELAEQVKEIEAKVRELVVHRRAARVLKAFWESRKQRTLARTNSAHGKWLQVVTGYVRVKDLATLEQTLSREFPNISLEVEDPGPDEDVPVSISLPPLVRPVQLLVNMFGLPKYGAFDPSPYLMFSFFLFFGICFGDVAYGTMLLALSLYIMKRARAYEGVYNFAKLLFFAGMPTVVFGFLLGSCFGDLYQAQYLGENNPLLKLMSATTVINPMDKPVIVLVIALMIGVLNQFYALGLRMYGALKQDDKATAIYDGLLWLITLPGFVILVSKMFVTPPPYLFYPGLVLFLGGAVGLILTQGRDAKNPVARLLAGVVSLYGIVGSYGITSFIGDSMSYCRLLALGLTTSIVAMSFNMMASLLRPIPYVGIVVFIFALVAGHGFNFFISVMGAFVHSMRLILVEFFGRFYEGGARPFSPLGFDSEAAILKKAQP